VTIRRFEDIESWRLARQFTLHIYNASNAGQFRRDFMLRDQLRRAAVSIMANIAEGFGRKGKNDFVRFLTIAQASALEVQSHLYISFDLGYLSPAHFEALFAQSKRIEQLIGGFIRHLRLA
jgi:four helix bundle protein